MLAGVLEKPGTVENPPREVSKIRSRVTDAMEDGVRSARQAIRHGRYARKTQSRKRNTLSSRGHYRQWTQVLRPASWQEPFNLGRIPSSLSAGQQKALHAV